ncbi:hypothetical protein FNF29_02145 [Cafeteria roenbergensis]|uniref:TmcB/TmcC TPR repeats domain-containing protein n=1 Tax=Cafeteria roenbergensis TaxID=33653 RepID=A0A5A8CTA1_CAFRO|nr:hypothetical protein FNF29_02145 [Cafeteria roenbergensis]|eukprot:KAA0155001.1 hypothetical protein FNF29_02145 [Cafeteria roenbergensis]
MAATMEEQSPLLERIGNVLLNGLFGLGLIARDQKGKASGLRQGSTSFGALSFVLATVIEAGQMLAFPFSASQTVWRDTVIGNAAGPVLTVVMPASLDVWFGPMAYRVMFFLGIAWVLIFISLSVSIAVAFIREKKQSEFALRLFRGVAVLSTTVLFLPVSSLLFRSYSCSAGSDISGSTDDWLGAGIPCDNVWRMICLGVVAVLLVLFFILAMFVAATFVDRHPGSLRWAAKSHGRVAIALLVAKVILTAIYNVSPAAARSLGTCIALIITALGWLVALYRELPMLRPVANALRAGSATAFLWANVALLVAMMMPGHDVSVMAVMTLVGIPVAALAGGMLVLTEARRVVSGKLSDCVSVSHIVLWASARVQEAEQIQHKAEGTPVAIAIDRLASAFSLKYIEQTENYTDDSLEADEARMRSVVVKGKHGLHAVDQAAGVSGAGGHGPVSGLDAGMPIDSDAEATARRRLSLLAAAEEAYRTAMKSEASGLALVAAAKFYEAFSPHKQQEVDCIGKLKAMQPAPDLAFVVFVRGIELSDSSAGDGRLAAIDRVMFEQMADETRALRATALRSMVELWAHLEQKRPDLWQVLQTGARLDADIVRCDFLFSRMLRLNPESTTILRAYSGFLSGLGFDPVRGMELRNRADRIDEVASRQRVSKVASVSLFSYGASLKGNRQLQLALTDASSPVVTISTSSSNRGEIVAVTPAAAKLLLATRAASLIGQNISTIVPPPFQDFHQHMLDGFGRSVTSESSIVGHELMLPVARRDGTIIACNLTFDESPPDAATMQPRLAAVLHPVPSAHDLVLFVGEADGFRIASASRGALTLLGIDAEVLKDRHTPLTSFLPSLSPSFVPFMTRSSGREELRTLRDAASLAESGSSSTAATPGPSVRRPARGAGIGSGSSLMAQVKPDKRGIARVRVAPMLSLKETGLVPLEFQGAPCATVLAGSVQCMRMMGSEVFLLRFVPTRLVIPAGVPLDGSEAELVMEDSPEAGSRPSMALGVRTNIDSTQRAGPPREVEFATSKSPDSQSVDSADVVLSQAGIGEDGADGTPRANLLLPVPQADDLARTASGRGQAGEGPQAAEQDAKLLPSPDLPAEGANDASMTELLRPAADSTRPKAKSESAGPQSSETAALVKGADEGADGGLSQTVVTASDRGAAVVQVQEKPTRPLKGALKLASPPHEDHSHPSAVLPEQGAALGETKATTSIFAGGASSAGESSAGGAAQVGGLLRAVLRRNDGREGETNRIRLVLLLSAACVILASVGTAVWIDQSRVTMEGRSEGLRLSTVRMHAFHEAWTAAVAIFTNVSGASDISLGPVDSIHQDFKAAADRMHWASKMLHDAAERAGPSGAQYDLNHTFEMVEPSPDTLTEPVVKQRTIGDAETFMYGVTGVLKSLPPSQWMSPPGVQAFATMQANEIGFRAAVERSLGHREHDFALLLPAMAEQIIYAGTAFLVGVILTSLVAITVAVTSLWRRSINTMQLFLTFPAEVSGSLRQLASIQLEAADADGTAGMDGDEDDDEPAAPRFMADGPLVTEGETRSGRFGVEDESETRSGVLSRGLSRTGSRRGIGTPRQSAAGGGKDDEPGETDEAMRNQVINEADATARWEAALQALKSLRRSRGRRSGSPLFRDRQFNVSNGFVVSSLLWLLLPVVMIGIWLGTVVLVSVASYDRSSGQANRILQTSHVALHTDEIESYLMLAAANQTKLVELLHLPNWQQTMLADAAGAEENLSLESQILIFGGYSCSAIDICELLEPLREGDTVIAPVSAALFLTDACLGALSATKADCRSVGGGVLGQGLLAAVAHITGLARQFLVSYTISNRTVPTALELSRIRELTDMTYPHARSAFHRASYDLIDSTLAVLIDGQNIALTVTWVFALVYMGVTAIWLSSQVTQLAWPLRTARRLVRFLPADLILAVPNLRHGLREVASGVRVTSQKREWCKWKCCTKPSRRVAIASSPSASKPARIAGGQVRS